MPGPRPKPQAIRLLNGNASRRPLNNLEPLTKLLDVEPSPAMDSESKEFWNAVAPIVRAMKVAQESDRLALELLSICLAQARAAHLKFILKNTTTYSGGVEQVSPYFTIMTKMIAQAMKIMCEFGMTPASRTKVKAIVKGEKKDSLEGFLDGDSESEEDESGESLH